MLDSLHTFLLGQPVLVFFLTLSLGYLVGNIRVFGISLGSVGGVLLAGLFFGHLGFSMNPGMQTMGFVLFIFCVGYQAGPQFFDVLMTSGLKYLSLALVVAGTAFGLAWLLAGWLDFEPGLGAGLLGGAITSTPTLAAAQDAVRSGLVDVAPGVSEQDIIVNIGAGYALTYLFGLILVIRLLPGILGVELPAEARKVDAGPDLEAGPNLASITRRAYRITAEQGLERTVTQMERASPRGVSVSAIRRDGELSPAELLRYRGLMLMSMRRLESVYHQHQLGSITKEQMQGFELSMISLVRMPLARQWWEEARATFHEGFASAVDARLAKDDLLVRHPSIAGD